MSWSIRPLNLFGGLLVVWGLVLFSGANAQQQLSMADTVQVIAGPLNVRNTPGTGGAVTGQLVQDQTALVMDGSPYWADGYWWWSILADDGTVGWVAEGDATEAYIWLVPTVAASTPVVPEPEPGPTPEPLLEPEAAEAPEVEVFVPAEASPENTAVDDSIAATPISAPVESADQEPVAEVMPEPLPDPYAHLPEPIRAERELIDSELDGFWVSLARYGVGPSRSGSAFSWGFTETRRSGPNPHYWCELKMLTNGPPFFERIELSEADEQFFEDGSLSVGDLDVSCTDSGSLRIAASELNRTLAVLRPVWPYAKDRASLDPAELGIAGGHSLTLGTLTWLEVGGGDTSEAASDWQCGTAQPGIFPSNPLTQSVQRCERVGETAGKSEVLLIDTEAGSITWEFSASD